MALLQVHAITAIRNGMPCSMSYFTKDCIVIIHGSCSCCATGAAAVAAAGTLGAGVSAGMLGAVALAGTLIAVALASVIAFRAALGAGGQGIR